MDPQPPRRTTHASGGPARLLVYDRWGRYGRPVLLLHGLRYDRTMWWPVAAELATATTCTVIAPDLPGHGDSPARNRHDEAPTQHDPADTRHDPAHTQHDPAHLTHDPAHLTHDPAHLTHDPAHLAHDLGRLVHGLGLHRAPVVVGHAESAALADAFASQFAVHQVLTVDDLGDGRAEIPEHYRPYARARVDPGVLTAYGKWPPLAPTWPHLADPAGFAAGLRARIGARG
jgi:pimeloyl-ACP methyl ester carboxylesterase